MDSLIFAGITAGLITLAGEIWYNCSVLTGRTRPDSGGWWILSISWMLMATSHYSVGGTASMIVPAVFTLSIVITAILATFYGVAFVVGRFEVVVLGVVVASIALWWHFDSPRLALLANMGVNACGMILMLRKTALRPGSEALGPWAVTVAGDLVNLFAIGDAPDEWILPTYLFVINACMLTLIVAGSLSLLRSSRVPR